MFFTTGDETLPTASHVISFERRLIWRYFLLRNGNQSIINTTNIFAAGENKKASLRTSLVQQLAVYPKTKCTKSLPAYSTELGPRFPVYSYSSIYGWR
jgi:hypothetical protein